MTLTELKDQALEQDRKFEAKLIEADQILFGAEEGETEAEIAERKSTAYSIYTKAAQEACQAWRKVVLKAKAVGR